MVGVMIIIMHKVKWLLEFEPATDHFTTIPTNLNMYILQKKMAHRFHATILDVCIVRRGMTEWIWILNFEHEYNARLIGNCGLRPRWPPTHTVWFISSVPPRNIEYCLSICFVLIIMCMQYIRLIEVRYNKLPHFSREVSFIPII